MPRNGRVSLKPQDTAQLGAWERVQLARHPQRPFTLDYLQLAFSEFVELHGDRLFGDDAAIIGEGGSGGALALGVTDRVIMLENAIYSVASPEAAASILWKEGGHHAETAEAMKITAPDLLGFGIVDALVREPPGGAHTDYA